MPSSGCVRGSDTSVLLHTAPLGFPTAWQLRAGRAADVEAAYFLGWAGRSCVSLKAQPWKPCSISSISRYHIQQML